MAKTTWKKGIPLDAAAQERLRAFVRERGEREAAAEIGVGVATLIRGAAGLGLRGGNVRLIEMALGMRQVAA